jgi:hypothetical protein
MILPLNDPLPNDGGCDFRSLEFLFSFMEVRACQWILFDIYMTEDSEFYLDFKRSRRMNLELIRKGIF